MSIHRTSAPISWAFPLQVAKEYTESWPILENNYKHNAASPAHFLKPGYSVLSSLSPDVINFTCAHMYINACACLCACMCNCVYGDQSQLQVDSHNPIALHLNNGVTVGRQGLSLNPELIHSAGLAGHQDPRILCLYLHSFRIPGTSSHGVWIFTSVLGILAKALMFS
jgi:hypothetical protein